uniref:Uncharacterized protein n=1 Tax=Zea mays TaxID=4577 RepID=C0P2P1_MAIZE|nr:unknown [Zea mays]
MPCSHEFAASITGISCGNNACLSKIAVKGMLAIGLEVEVHGVRRVGLHRVRLVADAARPDRGTVDALLAAREVDVLLQHHLVRRRLRHAPFPARHLRSHRLKGLRISEDADVVDRRHVAAEQAEIPLRHRPWLEVLVEEGEDGDLEGAVGHERRADAGAEVADGVAVVVPGEVRADADLPVLPGRWPPGLRHGDVDVPEAHPPDGRVHGVELRVQHVAVHQPGALVHDAVVHPEQREVEAAVVGERVERVRVHHERRAGRAEEPEQRPHDGRVVAVAEPRRRRLLRGGEHPERVRGGDLHPAVQGRGDQRGVQVLHGRHQRQQQRPVGLGGHLVADQEARDIGGARVGRHVVAHPAPREGQIQQVRDDAVGHRHVHGEARAGEGPQQDRVGVQQPHAVEDGVPGQEPRHVGRRRERRAPRAVVDADAASVRACDGRNQEQRWKEDLEQDGAECHRGKIGCCHLLLLLSTYY